MVVKYYISYAIDIEAFKKIVFLFISVVVNDVEPLLHLLILSAIYCISEGIWVKIDTVFISEKMRVPKKICGMFSTYRVDWFSRSFFYTQFLGHAWYVDMS